MRTRFKGLKTTTATMMAVLLAVAAAGCSKGEEASKPAASNEVKAKVPLKIYVPSNVEEFPAGKTVNNNEIKSFVEEKTGYSLQWDIQPKENVKEKLNIMMASGEAPDLIMTTDKTIFANFAQQGLLAPLDSYIDQVAPEIKKLVPNDTWKAVTFDGKKYAIAVPQNQEATSGLIMRKDWLDALGLQVPKTLEDYYQVLKAFKQAGKTIPLVAGAADGNGNAFGYLDAFAGAFGLAVPYALKDGKIVHTRAEPEAKEFLAYMNKLYNEGLLDKEYPVNKKANVTEKLVGGKAAMTTLGWADAKGITESLIQKEPNAKFVYVDPPVGKNGMSGVSKNSPVRTYLMVPASSKHPKEVVDFVNKYMNPEVLTVVSYGWEGKHFERKDGAIVATPEAEQIRYRIYYTLWDTLQDFQNRVKLKGFSTYYDPIIKHAKVENMLSLAPPIDVIEKKNQELTDLTNEYFIKIITGALPIDAYDDYLKKWKSMGGTESVDAINKWYTSVK